MNQDYYHVHEWTPELTRFADRLIAQIHKVAPELKVLFMGSAALGLPGNREIDLDVLCDEYDLKRYVDVLMPVLGTPQAFTDTKVMWNYVRDGIEIDCILSDPKTADSHVPKQKKDFEILKTNTKLQEQYKQLKYDWDGLPLDQYKAKKKAFWEMILSQRH